MNDSITIGKAASLAGLSTQAIRYYEREGLVPKPSRTHTGYRVYGPEAVRRLNFIRTARTLGLSLDEIKEILRLSRTGRAPCCRVRELLGEKLDDLDRRISELRRFRANLDDLLHELAVVPDQADTSEQICTLIEGAPDLIPLCEVTGEQPELARQRNARKTKGRMR